MASIDVDHVVGWIAAVVGGGLGVKLLEVWAKRADAERREPASLTKASAELSEALSHGSTALLDEFRREFTFLRGRVADQERELSAVKRIAEAAQGDHSHCQAQLQELREEIARLMAGRVAGPFEKPPQ